MPEKLGILTGLSYISASREPVLPLEGGARNAR
jgi:hypothetical protein